MRDKNWRLRKAALWESCIEFALAETERKAMNKLSMCFCYSFLFQFTKCLGKEGSSKHLKNVINQVVFSLGNIKRVDNHINFLTSLPIRFSEMEIELNAFTIGTRLQPKRSSNASSAVGR